MSEGGSEDKNKYMSDLKVFSKSVLPEYPLHILFYGI